MAKVGRPTTPAMEYPNLVKLARIRRESKLNYRQLAEKAGVTYITLVKALERKGLKQKHSRTA